jgi:hypothetical protein
VAAVVPRPSVNSWEARKISRVAAQLPISKAVTPIIRRPSGPCSNGWTVIRIGW